MPIGADPAATASDKRFKSFLTAAALGDATLTAFPAAKVALTINNHVFDALARNKFSTASWEGIFVKCGLQL